MYAIETEHLTKFYGKARGIADVTLRVEQGDFYGFIGPNGAGKSTLIRTLLGLLSPTGGSAKVLGLDIAKDRSEILSRVGYLPSEAAFYSGMRVRDVLRFSAKLRNQDCSAEAKALCERLELDTTRKVSQLSLGNRKKVGIVCALQHRPDLYVLDEPTSGLDPLMQREFYAILTERCAEGATVFLSSHVLSEVGRYCRTAGVIREGRLLASDRVENLGKTGVKRVTLRGAKDFLAPAMARDVREESDSLSFLYAGTPRELLAALSGMTFEDFNIADPDLEEVFLHYYQKEEC